MNILTNVVDGVKVTAKGAQIDSSNKRGASLSTTVDDTTEASELSFQQAAALVVSHNQPSKPLANGESALFAPQSELLGGEAEDLALTTPQLNTDDASVLTQNSTVNAGLLPTVPLGEHTEVGDGLQSDHALLKHPLATVGREVAAVVEGSKTLSNEAQVPGAAAVEGGDSMVAPEASTATEDLLATAGLERQQGLRSDSLPVNKAALSANEFKSSAPLSPSQGNGEAAIEQAQIPLAERSQLSKATQSSETAPMTAIDDTKPTEFKRQIGVSPDTLASKVSRSDSAGDLGLAFEEAMMEQSDNDSKNHNLIREASSSSSNAKLSGSTRVQIPVSIHFSKPEWSSMVADRTALMFAQNVTSADLQLDPPELGPLQVKVSVNQDQASVVFTVANAAVRDSVDQSVARLKELLAQQGLDLVNVDVSDQQQSSSQQHSGDENLHSDTNYSKEEDLEQHEAEQREIKLNYGIDSYA